MTAVTNKLLNLKKCVPSTLQIGCSGASGGLIIPRGSLADSRHNFPGSSSDSRYNLILGAGMPATQEQQAVASEQWDQDDKPAQDASSGRKASPLPNPATLIASGQNSPGCHHFLPHHPPNRHISPQYGFYVNITPPMPKLYMKEGDKFSKNAAMQQQSYL
jgi:hypothetical protein